MRTYCCSRCMREGVKLWRQYNTFADHLELLCRTCAIVDQQKEIDRQAESWARVGVKRQESDQIGGLVPAVPDVLPRGPSWALDKNFSFWGYTSVPQSGVDWWKSLP